MKLSNVKSHILGFPRIGANRELKWAQEDYWSGKITQGQLVHEATQLKERNWQLQKEAGLDFITVGDFAWYDHVLNLSSYLGVVPERFNHPKGAPVDLDTYFRMARGRSVSGKDAAACEMTKWFDTNYHYIVPELNIDQSFHVNAASLIHEIEQAKSFEVEVKPVLIGPLTYLWLSKEQGSFNKLDLLPDLLEAYGLLLLQIQETGVNWIQIDEPILSLDLSLEWKSAFERCYNQLNRNGLNILLASYFSPVADNLSLACSLPVAGHHLDAVAGASDLDSILDKLPAYKVLSLGVVNGRNIWRCNLSGALDLLKPFAEKLRERLWVGSSCSLLHSPVDLASETQIPEEIKAGFAFATQKLVEVSTLADALNGNQQNKLFEQSDAAVAKRLESQVIHNQTVQQAVAAITPESCQRQKPYQERIELQKQQLKLPLFPTTTIGSFPQTQDIRQARRQFKSGVLTSEEYVRVMQDTIQEVIREQETIGLDVLVHGEAERNDMVEYFGEQLQGYCFTQNGWVQSYGSRCVKPPIIYGDVSRPSAMTVDWSTYAQSLTTKPVKGMLTGPITMLCWSFAREDIALKEQAQQIALALKDEVADLQAAGIKVIQMDEPALREGLPLRKAQWQQYLNWAVESFKLSVASAEDQTQIHTHMCYCEFNDIIESIAALDADVITIETSRSNMELLEAFEEFEYPNEIGPGVYDIHSPIVPTKEWMQRLMEKAAKRIPKERLWVNPDCGLKTRGWSETRAALALMVEAAQALREETLETA